MLGEERRRRRIRRNGFQVVWYHGTFVHDIPEETLAEEQKFAIERVQTGVRMEKRLLKVLKGLAEYHDITLGDLLEGLVLHAFDGKAPFSANSLQLIRELKKIYGLKLDSRASHRLTESRGGQTYKEGGDKS